MTNEQPVERREHPFLIGLIAGGVVGAGLAILVSHRLGPQLKRIGDSARTLGKATAERYQEASARVNETIDDLAAQGRGFRDDLRAAVAPKP